MDTKETFAKCCNFGGKRKKIIVALVAIILVGIIALAVVEGAKSKLREVQNRSGMMFDYDNEKNFQGMMSSGGGFHGNSLQLGDENQFVIPSDGAKTGELAIIVNDLETAKKTITTLAEKNGGSVWATNISYVSEKLRNGSIVVQVPAEKFEAAFAMLKSVGNKIVQESTQKIPEINIYPMMQPLAVQEKTDNLSVDNPNYATTSDNDKAVKKTVVDQASPSVAIYPGPQQIQNKGYIRIVFVDYDNNEKLRGSMMNFENTSPPVRTLWIALGLKLVILLILLIILLIMFKRIFHNYRAIRASKKTKPTVHVVRQMSKPRQRIVRIAKKK